MKTMSAFNKLKPLLKKPLFRSSEARIIGISAALLAYYVKKGFIQRVDRGVYRGVNAPQNVDFQWEDLFYAVKSIPSGVVCLISALAIYELTDEIPRAHWIAVPHAARAPKRKMAKIIRMRNMNLGKTDIKLGEEKIKIFDKERTIIDSFRYLPFEIAMKALKMGLKLGGEKKLNQRRLSDYAKKLRVNIRPYILAVTT